VTAMQPLSHEETTAKSKMCQLIDLNKRPEDTQLTDKPPIFFGRDSYIHDSIPGLPLGILDPELEKNKFRYEDIKREEIIPQKRKLCLKESLTQIPIQNPSNIKKLKKDEIKPTSNTKDNSNSQSLDFTIILDTKKDNNELFNVEDWDYVRGNQERKTTRCNQKFPIKFHQDKIFQILKGCLLTHQRPEESFFIPRNGVKHFITKYKSCRNELEFPKGIRDDKRICALFDTVYKLSNQRINFDSYKIYSEGIIKKNLPNDKTKGIANKIIETVEQVTKTATFLVIIYLSLFGEHKKAVLTTDEIEDILCVFSELWAAIHDICSHPELNQEFDWLSEMSHFLKTGKSSNIVTKKRTCKGKNGIYKMAWNFVEYWTRRSRKVVERGLSRKKDCHQFFVTLINKIIFSLNYDDIVRGLN
jgi:hypothetical protein